MEKLSNRVEYRMDKVAGGRGGSQDSTEAVVLEVAIKSARDASPWRRTADRVNTTIQPASSSSRSSTTRPGDRSPRSMSKERVIAADRTRRRRPLGLAVAGMLSTIPYYLIAGQCAKIIGDIRDQKLRMLRNSSDLVE